VIDILLRFLLVALNIDAILGETSVARRKDMLRKVATTGVDLDSVYDQTLRRIREQKGDRSRLGMEVLMWVSHAERPLRINELCHALAVEMEATDIDLENVRPLDTVLGSCFGLAVVDKETSTIRLIHYTLQEYLLRPGVFPDAHRTLGQTCLTYLSYDQVKRLPADNISNLRDMPFLEYSSLHWGRHAKIELSDHAKFLALDLLSRYDSHIASTILLDKILGYHSSQPTHHLFTGLHCASYFGIDEMVAALIEGQGSDINQGEWMGATPLILAAQEGNQGAVSLLLAQDDIDPGKPDNSDGTPLLWASRNGHEGVVRLLLARDDVNPNKPDNDGETPLWRASFNGHEGLVRLLLARDDVSPDKPDNDGEAPLWWASRNGHEGVVRLLLARDDVNPDKPNNSGGTPLWWASCKGNEGLVRLLLARDDVNPNKPDNDGKTPLWCASFKGHEGVVRLLLARDDVSPDKPDNDGRTPLWRASFKGHEGVVRLLLAQDDVNPNQPDNNAKTPFCVASRMGHEGVAMLLLSRGATNPDKPNNSPVPPQGTSSNYNERALRSPVAPGDVAPDQPDNDDITPLPCAPSDIHEEVVRSPVPQDNDTPEEPPPKTSRMRRYRQIIAQHIFPCWVEKRETRPKNGYSISFGHVLEILRWHCIFIHNFHLLALYIILLELVMDRV